MAAESVRQSVSMGVGSFSLQHSAPQTAQLPNLSQQPQKHESNLIFQNHNTAQLPQSHKSNNIQQSTPWEIFLIFKKSQFTIKNKKQFLFSFLAVIPFQSNKTS